MPSSLDPVSSQFGLGDALKDQVGTETEDERRKRLLALQQQASLQPISSMLGRTGIGAVSSTLGGGLVGGR